jgi:hypothetical protein
MSNKPKTYRVSFIPIQTLEYEYVVEANNEDDAAYAAKELLQGDVGWDSAKDFNLRTLEDVWKLD